MAPFQGARAGANPATRSEKFTKENYHTGKYSSHRFSYFFLKKETRLLPASGFFVV